MCTPLCAMLLFLFVPLALRGEFGCLKAALLRTGALYERAALILIRKAPADITDPVLFKELSFSWFSLFLNVLKLSENSFTGVFKCLILTKLIL